MALRFGLDPLQDKPPARSQELFGRPGHDCHTSTKHQAPIPFTASQELQALEIKQVKMNKQRYIRKSRTTKKAENPTAIFKNPVWRPAILTISY
jgi:hypothetical protein